jgi:hypothetical protein
VSRVVDFSQPSRDTKLGIVKTRAALFVATLVAGSTAAADTRVLVETNPLAPVFRGASLGARAVLDVAPRWSFGGGAYAFTLPDVFVDGIAGNADEGWQVAIRPAFYASVDRHLRDGGAGVGFGVSVVLARFVVGNDAVSDTRSFLSLYAVPRISYTWFAWSELFLQISLGVELHVPLGDAPVLAGAEFTRPQIQPSPGVMVGYRF